MAPHRSSAAPPPSWRGPAAPGPPGSPWSRFAARETKWGCSSLFFSRRPGFARQRETKRKAEANRLVLGLCLFFFFFFWGGSSQKINRGCPCGGWFRRNPKGKPPVCGGGGGGYSHVRLSPAAHSMYLDRKGLPYESETCAPCSQYFLAQKKPRWLHGWQFTVPIADRPPRPKARLAILPSVHAIHNLPGRKPSKKRSKENALGFRAGEKGGKRKEKKTTGTRKATAWL